MRFLKSEAGAVLLWVAASLLLAALLAPWLYQGGKQFAELANEQAAGGVLGWLGNACRRADFGRYFNRNLVLVGLMLLPVLWRRLRRLRRLEVREPPVRVERAWRQGMLLWVMGVVVAGGVAWGLGMILQQMGVFGTNPVRPSLTALLYKSVLAAVTVSLVEEWLFRGILLDLWLRLSRPVAACIGTSLVFALVHFLRPPSGYTIENPASLVAGFQWLGGILLHFTQPKFITADFLALFAGGLVLAGARIRTGGLWLSMGLHSGWVLVFKTHNLTHFKLADGPLGAVLIGDSLRTGLLPMLALGVTAGICHVLLRTVHDRTPDARG